MNDKEIEMLSKEIMLTTDRLNKLIGRAHAAGFRVDVDEFTTQEIQNKWPRPLIQVTVLKEV